MILYPSLLILITRLSLQLHHKKHIDEDERRREQHGVEAVQHSAVTGNQRSRILDPGGALEHRLHQVAQNPRSGRDERQPGPHPTAAVHHAGGDESQDNGPGDTAEEPFPRLLGRKAFAQAVPADGHAHQIGENVVGPDDENVENHHPGTPRLAADDRNVTHQRERQRHVDDAHESDADIGGGILPTAVKFADEHGGQQQQQKGHSAGESLPGAAEYLDVVRHECEIQGEKHESRSQSDDPLGIAALLPGQGIELRHADDQQRRQQQAETPLRPCVGALKPLLLELADYHNQTALNFRGLYPLVCADEKIRTLQRGISAGKTVAAVLAVDHAWKGFCVFSHTDVCGSIDYLYIRQELRGQGAGKMLMQWMLERLERLPLKLLELKVVCGNTEAERFYEHYGFAARTITMAKELK